MKTILKTAVTGFVGLTFLSACADQTAETQTIDLPQTHQNIVSAINAGFDAADAGNAAGTAKAGSSLAAMKAQPLRGMVNLADQWQENVQAEPPMRGRVRGPGYRVSVLGNGEAEQFGEVFYGVEEATISVSGDGRYTISVLDEGGNPPLCEAQTLCRFTPNVTAQYQVVIRNEGASGRYVFVAD